MSRESPNNVARARKLVRKVVVTGALILAPTLASGQDDPMRPPTPEELARFGPDPAGTKGESFRLQSVLIAPDRRVAIVNDRRLVVGDMIDGARVTAIEPGGIVLETADRTIELKVRTWSDRIPR